MLANDKFKINGELFNKIFHNVKPNQPKELMYNIYSLIEETNNDNEAQSEVLSESTIQDAFAPKDIFEIANFKSLI